MNLLTWEATIPFLLSHSFRDKICHWCSVGKEFWKGLANACVRQPFISIRILQLAELCRESFFLGGGVGSIQFGVSSCDRLAPLLCICGKAVYQGRSMWLRIADIKTQGTKVERSQSPIVSLRMPLGTQGSHLAAPLKDSMTLWSFWDQTLAPHLDP